MALASRDDSKLDQWDHMELKFGRLLGEDPKLTLAKIIGRKSNPDMSYLDIEKSFNKKKGKLNDDVTEVPLHEVEESEGSNSSNNLLSYTKNKDGGKELNLVRPLLKRGTKFEEPNDEPAIMTDAKSRQMVQKIDNKVNISNVTLRKPSTMQADNNEEQKSSKFEIKPNLFLKMRKRLNENVGDTLAKKENTSDVTLLKRPEPVCLTLNSRHENVSSSDPVGLSSSAMPSDEIESNEAKADGLQQDGMGTSFVEELERPLRNDDASFSRPSKSRDMLKTGLQQIGQSNVGHPGVQAGFAQPLDLKSDHSTSNVSIQSALHGKPLRMDQPVKQNVPSDGVGKTVLNIDQNNAAESNQFQPTALEGHEDGDWSKVEELHQTGERGEVELISSSSRGFVVLFGSLVGFLPYRNLGAKWKFLAFESWLRRKGLDPSLYKQNLSILGSHEIQNKNVVSDTNLNQETNQQVEENPAVAMKFEDLLEAYDQEKMKFLSSFVGQRIKVSVVLADRNSRRLKFSGRPREKEELVEKKRSLMSRLSIGDVVKCCIKKITYFGIFVEVEGVPALIHQSEVSWDATLDPSSYYKIGQIIEAKVHQLDFALERFTLSLKQITPDPLTEALESLESLVSVHTSVDRNLETAAIEWADVESLIKELEKIEGVDRVSKGRFFLSPGLAPTFQVYMASVFQNQYKLLARSGNKVQEMIVQANLDKKQMKAAILTCTNRVE